MPDVFQRVPAEPDIRIIIMQIRNPPDLTVPASIFTDIMPCRRTGNQSQIDRHACLCQLPANVHGNMMHSCNVCQCVKRHDLPPKPHQFIYPLPAKTFQKTPILLPIRAFCNLLLLRKRKIPRSRKRQTFAFLFHEHPQSRQIKENRPARQRFQRNILSGRVNLPYKKTVGIGEPALLRRFPCKRFHCLRAEFQHSGTGNLPAQDILQPIQPAFPLQQGKDGLFFQSRFPQKALFRQRDQKRFVKYVDLFFLHRQSLSVGFLIILTFLPCPFNRNPIVSDISKIHCFF